MVLFTMILYLVANAEYSHYFSDFGVGAATPAIVKFIIYISTIIYYYYLIYPTTLLSSCC